LDDYYARISSAEDYCVVETLKLCRLDSEKNSHSISLQAIRSAFGSDLKVHDIIEAVFQRPEVLSVEAKDMHLIIKPEMFYLEHFHEQEKPADKTAVCLNGELKPGDLVLSSPTNDYSCLIGRVLYIEKSGTPEHGTENPGDDIHVNFTEAEYSHGRFVEIDRMLGDLYGRPTTPGIWPPIDVDDAIMAPEMLIRITDIDRSFLTWIADSQKNAETYWNMAEAQTSKGIAPPVKEIADRPNVPEKNSVLAQLREATKELKPRSAAKDKPNKSGPEL